LSLSFFTIKTGSAAGVSPSFSFNNLRHRFLRTLYSGFFCA
jgi:hypothetical protein